MGSAMLQTAHALSAVGKKPSKIICAVKRSSLDKHFCTPTCMCPCGVHDRQSQTCSHICCAHLNELLHSNTNTNDQNSVLDFCRVSLCERIRVLSLLHLCMLTVVPHIFVLQLIRMCNGGQGSHDQQIISHHVSTTFLVHHHRCGCEY